MKTALTSVSSRSNIGLDTRFIYNLVIAYRIAIAATAVNKTELMLQYVPITRSNTLIKRKLNNLTRRFGYIDELHNSAYLMHIA